MAKITWMGSMNTNKIKFFLNEKLILSDSIKTKGSSEIHIDEIDNKLISKDQWIKISKYYFKILSEEIINKKLPYYPALVFSLKSSNEKIGINFKNENTLLSELDESPPSIYLFFKNFNPWIDYEIEGTKLKKDILNLDLDNIETKYFEFKNKYSDEYNRTVLFCNPIDTEEIYKNLDISIDTIKKIYEEFNNFEFKNNNELNIQKNIIKFTPDKILLSYLDKLNKDNFQNSKILSQEIIILKEATLDVSIKARKILEENILKEGSFIFKNWKEKFPNALNVYTEIEIQEYTKELSFSKQLLIIGT